MVTNNTRRSARNTSRNAARGSQAAPAPAKNVVTEAQIVDFENANDGTETTTTQRGATRTFGFQRRASMLKQATDHEAFQTEQQKAAAKRALVSQAKQQLAEVADLQNDVNATQAEMRSLSGRAAMALYQARSQNLLSLEEMTGQIGDVFGFRKKGDAQTKVIAGDKEASKTPFGNGEEIRKRVIRLVKAGEYVRDGRGDRFFSDVPEAKQAEFRSEVEAILNRLVVETPPEGLEGDELAAWQANQQANALSPFSAYDQLTDARKKALDGRETLAPAFDPKKVLGWVEALRSENALKKIEANEALAAAYEELGSALLELSEQASSEVEAEGDEGQSEGETEE